MKKTTLNKPVLAYYLFFMYLVMLYSPSNAQKNQSVLNTIINKVNTLSSASKRIFSIPLNGAISLGAHSIYGIQSLGNGLKHLGSNFFEGFYPANENKITIKNISKNIDNNQNKKQFPNNTQGNRAFFKIVYNKFMPVTGTEAQNLHNIIIQTLDNNQNKRRFPNNQKDNRTFSEIVYDKFMPVTGTEAQNLHNITIQNLDYAHKELEDAIFNESNDVKAHIDQLSMMHKKNILHNGNLNSIDKKINNLEDAVNNLNENIVPQSKDICDKTDQINSTVNTQSEAISNLKDKIKQANKEINNLHKIIATLKKNEEKLNSHIRLKENNEKLDCEKTIIELMIKYMIYCKMTKDQSKDIIQLMFISEIKNLFEKNKKSFVILQNIFPDIEKIETDEQILQLLEKNKDLYFSKTLSMDKQSDLEETNITSETKFTTNKSTPNSIDVNKKSSKNFFSSITANKNDDSKKNSNLLTLLCQSIQNYNYINNIFGDNNDSKINSNLIKVDSENTENTSKKTENTSEKTENTSENKIHKFKMNLAYNSLIMQQRTNNNIININKE